MNKKIITTGLVASLLVVGGANQVLDTTLTAQAVQTQNQQQGRQLVSLGASVTDQQAQQTLQLLGAGHVPASNITYVDGNMVNRYLNDGSNASTTVLSSAYIAEMPQGYGVRVNIVTPQNITLVSSTTYQNAAVTAGVQNAQLNIATVAPVTGEGALVGIYALLENEGSLNQQDAQVAQKEIEVINNITNNTQINNIQINQMIKEIKIAIVNQNIQNNGDLNVVQIVQQFANENGISNQEVIDELIKYFEEFKQTEAASTEETADQLENSIVMSWPEQLASLSEAKSADEILEADRLDYTDQDKFHPAFQAFSDKLYQLIEQDAPIQELYGHTFVFEKMTPNLTGDEKRALNELRTVMFEYSANKDSQPDQTKTIWTQTLNDFESLKTTDPTLAEIYQRIANASGYAPEAYMYIDLEQDDKEIKVSVRDESRPDQPIVGTYVYNLETGEISEVDSATDTLIPIADTFDFNAVYGVNVENNYPAQPISPDYTIPGYTPESSTSEEERSESDEEETSSDESETISEELPSIEEPVEPAPEESEPVVEQPVEETPATELPEEDVTSESSPA